MQIEVQAVTGLGPSTYATREVVLDPDLGLWGEALKVKTADGAIYTIKEVDGRLHVRCDSHHRILLDKPVSNVVEFVAAPLFHSMIFTKES